MKKMLLFDIDGTLLYTGGTGKIAFERAFEELFQIQNAWGQTIPHGKTDPLIIEEIAIRTLGRALKTKEYELLCKRYLVYFREEIKRSPRFELMAGVPQLLEMLSQKNDVLLGIATGNLEEAGWLKLERGGIRHFFKFGGFGSDSHERSEIVRHAIERSGEILGKSIQAEHIYVIGDTGHDIQSAKKLGLKSIGVATGNMDQNHLRPHKPTHLLENLSDLKLFFNLIGL